MGDPSDEQREGIEEATMRPTKGQVNLEKYFAMADSIDLEEGQNAYRRYHDLMLALSHRYDQPMDRVVAAFAALSPNNDYLGNLRSLVSVLVGLRDGVPDERITVSTYKHCRDRALAYMRGVPFVTPERGLKILNFYYNILRPEDSGYITIDGHMVAAYRDEDLTMKEAICRSKSEYMMIAHDARINAFRNFLLPNQYQAIVWFARKRTLNIKYDPQIDIFAPRGDTWHISRNIAYIEPFPTGSMIDERPNDGEA
jgi:hypothetical protein